VEQNDLVLDHHVHPGKVPLLFEPAQGRTNALGEDVVGHVWVRSTSADAVPSTVGNAAEVTGPPAEVVSGMSHHAPTRRIALEQDERADGDATNCQCAP
jgi:hypothetical protein